MECSRRREQGWWQSWEVLGGREWWYPLGQQLGWRKRQMVMGGDVGQSWREGPQHPWERVGAERLVS